VQGGRAFFARRMRAWEGGQGPLVQQITSFDFVLTSPLPRPAWRIQHGRQSIGTCSPHGSADLEHGSAATIADSDVQSLIQQEARMTRRCPSRPPTRSIRVSAALGSRSHSTAPRRAQNSAATTKTSTATSLCGHAVPDCGGARCSAVADAMTTTSLSRAMRGDHGPVPGHGWYDDQNGEIGGICAWKTKQLGTFMVQLEWSNKSGASASDGAGRSSTW